MAGQKFRAVTELRNAFGRLVSGVVGIAVIREQRSRLAELPVVSGPTGAEFSVNTGRGYTDALLHCASGAGRPEEERKQRARRVSTLRRVEAQARTAARMVEAEAGRDDVVIRLVIIMKTLRSLGAEVSCTHVEHCMQHRIEYGPEAGATAARTLAEAIRGLVQS